MRGSVRAVQLLVAHGMRFACTQARLNIRVTEYPDVCFRGTFVGDGRFRDVSVGVDCAKLAFARDEQKGVCHAFIDHRDRHRSITPCFLEYLYRKLDCHNTRIVNPNNYIITLILSLIAALNMMPGSLERRALYRTRVSTHGYDASVHHTSTTHLTHGRGAEWASASRPGVGIAAGADPRVRVQASYRGLHVRITESLSALVRSLRTHACMSVASGLSYRADLKTECPWASSAPAAAPTYPAQLLGKTGG